MTRISDASSINSLINQMLKTESRRVEANFQVVSGKISADYSGLATQSRRLVNLETTRDMGERFIKNNETAELRLNVMALSLESIDTVIRDFRQSLTDFQARSDFSQQSVEELQKFSFNSLKALEAFLNVEADGQFIFSGSKVNTEPVNMGLTSLDAFQTKYDGSVSKYATTRDAHLSSLAVTKDANNEKSEFINNSNWLTFRQNDDLDGDGTNDKVSSIEATSSLFSGHQAGSRISVTGTASNNGDYTVQSVSSDGTKIFLTTEMFTNETLPAGLSDDTAQSAVTFTLPDATQLTNGTTGNIDFARQAGTITAATAGAFATVNVGDTIVLGGAGQANGSFTVTAIDATSQVLTVSAGLDITLSDGSALDVNDTGAVVLDRTANTLTATTAGAFSGMAAGEKFTLGNTAENDGDYTVSSVSADGTQVTIVSSKLTDEGTTSGSTFFDYTVGSQLVFNVTTDVITAQNVAGTALAGVFSNLKAGDSITVANSPTNDGTYTVGSISADGSSITLDTSTTLPGSTETDNNGTAITAPARGFTYDAGNEIVFNDTTDTISLRDITTAGNGTLDIFDNLRVGMKITVAGTASNNGVFTVASIAADGASFTVSENITVAETFDPSVAGTAVTMKVFAADGAVTNSQSYYQGDTQSLTHRVDENRTIDIDVTAAHPTFEKMIRAMSLIAQGKFGSEGGLENNQVRIEQAVFLADDAIAAPSEGTPPFGAELQSDLNEIIFNLGFKQVILRDSMARQADFNNLLGGFISLTEDVDETEAITNLLSAQRSLEASYQALSRVFSMSLADFL